MKQHFKLLFMFLILSLMIVSCPSNRAYVTIIGSTDAPSQDIIKEAKQGESLTFTFNVFTSNDEFLDSAETQGLKISGLENFYTNPRTASVKALIKDVTTDENSKRTKATVEVSNFIPDKMTSSALPLEFEVPEVDEGKSTTILKTERKVVPLGGRKVKIFASEGSTPSEPSTPPDPDNPGDNTDPPTDPGDSGNTDKPSDFKGYVKIEPLSTETLIFKEDAEMTENNTISYRLVGAKILDDAENVSYYITIPSMYKMMRYTVSRDSDTVFTISFYGVACEANDKPTNFDVKVGKSVIVPDDGYEFEDDNFYLTTSLSLFIEYNRFAYISSGINERYFIAGETEPLYVNAIFNYCYLKDPIKAEDIVFDPPLPEGVEVLGVTFTPSLLSINIHLSAKNAPLKEVPEAEYALQGANLITGLWDHYSMPEDFSYKWKFSVRVR